MKTVMASTVTNPATAASTEVTAPRMGSTALWVSPKAPENPFLTRSSTPKRSFQDANHDEWRRESRMRGMAAMSSWS